jgi:glycosyltransferase involved in cell wall biosynthesis
MKVLYISHHKEASGWGQAARNYILAMDSVGIEVIPKAIRLNGSLANLPSRLIELENRSPYNCTHCIQHILPNYMKYDNSFKRSIGLFVLETKNISHTTWVDHINLMDEVWVPCIDMSFIHGINKPINIVPHTFDLEPYNKVYQKLNIPQLNNRFVFYFIGEYNRRKHIGALLRAFHTEFEPEEGVELVLKVNKSGISDKDLATEMVGFCNKIKENMRIYSNIDRYKSEIIITTYISEEDMLRLHANCDCFVNPSYGESWCTLPTTYINTNNGHKYIKDISKNDLVLSHTGKYQKVTNTFYRNYNGTIYSLDIKTIADVLDFTEKHKHYIVQRKNKRFNDIILLPKFIKTEDIKCNDLIAIPKIKDMSIYNKVDYIQISDYIDVSLDEDGFIKCEHNYNNKPKLSIRQIADHFGCVYQTVGKAINHKSNSELSKKIREFVEINDIDKPEILKIPNKIYLTKDFMFFLGHYISEGCFNTSKVCLSTHEDEIFGRNISQKAIYEAFNIKAKEIKLTSKSINVIFNNNIIGKFLQKLCGINCYNKYIHNDLKISTNIGYLLSGIFYGDGHFTKNKQLTFSTSSRQLKNDIIEIFNINNIHCRYGKDIRGKNATIQYEVCPLQQFIDRVFNLINLYKYNKQLVCPQFVGQRLILEDENCFYVPINKINKYNYCGLVYNITVAQDESYTTHGCATHNCIPAWEAMAMGNIVISSATGGPKDYIDSGRNGFLVNGSMEPVFGQTETVEEFGTAKESWFNISVSDLMKTMRRVYEMDKKRKNTIKMEAKTSTAIYSYNTVGHTMKELLNV